MSRAVAPASLSLVVEVSGSGAGELCEEGGRGSHHLVFLEASPTPFLSCCGESTHGGGPWRTVSLEGLGMQSEREAHSRSPQHKSSWHRHFMEGIARVRKEKWLGQNKEGTRGLYLNTGQLLEWLIAFICHQRSQETRGVRTPIPSHPLLPDTASL